MTSTVHVTADARPECIRPLRNVVASLARDQGLTDAQVYDVKLCVSEAITNAVKHAYPESEPGTVDVSVEEVGDMLAVVVADHGHVRKKSWKEHGGFGLAWVERLTHGLTFTAASDGTTVEMLFLLPRTRETPAPPVSARDAVRLSQDLSQAWLSAAGTS